MEQNEIIENKKSINGDNIEEITERIIKFMLKEKASIEDIKIVTNKSVEEIKRIGGLVD